MLGEAIKAKTVDRSIRVFVRVFLNRGLQSFQVQMQIFLTSACCELLHLELSFFANFAQSSDVLL